MLNGKSVLITVGTGSFGKNFTKTILEKYHYVKKLEFFQNEFGFNINVKLRDNYFENGKYFDSYILSLINS